MKSSKTANEFLSNSPAYSLFALLMPMMMLSAFIFILRALLPAWEDFINESFPLLAPFAGGALSAAAASLYCDFMKDTKASRTAATIRGTLVVAILSYIIASLCRWGIPWETRLFPSLSNVLAAAAAVYAWGAVISWKNLFNARKHFMEYVESYQGDELRQAVFRDPGLMQNMDEEIIKIKRKYLLQLVILGLMLIVIATLQIPVPLALYLLLGGVLIAGVCIIGSLGITRREPYYAGEGIVVSDFEKTRRILGMLLFCIVSLICAVLLSSNKNILPVSLIVAVFSKIIGFFVVFIGAFFWLIGWIVGLFSKPKMRKPGLDSGEAEPIVPFLDLERGGPSPFWTWLKYGLIAAAAAAFLWFLISPLFRLGRDKAAFKGLSFRQKLARIFAEWFSGLADAFASFFSFFKRGPQTRKLRKPKAEDVRRTAETILGAYSHAKKQDVKQSVTLFARLILWGSEARQVQWKPSHAPGEYCSLLAAAPPVDGEPAEARQSNKLEKIIRCGELFEQALYSAEVLSDAERKEFQNLVEEVTA